MANVMFKRGKQSALNTLINSEAENRFVDGAFYLTTDTDRLYVAQSANELVELNKSITIVDNIDDLPVSKDDTTRKIKGTEVAVGQFYYITATTPTDKQNTYGGNILAVCSAINATTGAITWVQVNPDTNDNDDNYVTAFSIQKNADKTSATTGITYDWSITQGNDDDTNTALALSGSFVISPDDIATLGGIAVDLDVTGDSANNKAIIATGGQGADQATDAGKVNIIGGQNVGVAVSGSDVTITSVDTNYTLGKAANSDTIVLTDSDDDPQGSVQFATDETYLTLDKTAEDKLTINHKEQSITATTYGEAGKVIDHRDSSATDATTTSKFSVPKVTVDKAGHVTSISTETFTLPVDNDTTYTTVTPTAGTGDNAGKLTVGINDGTEDLTKTSDKILYNTITIDGSEKTIYNTQDFGSFYSASKVDEKLNAVDAMSYKGTVGGTGATQSTLPTTNTAELGIKAGDTYKVSADGTYGGVSAHVGDLLIATGSEKDGVIDGTITWTLVPSGDYPDTLYAVSVQDDNIGTTETPDMVSQIVLTDSVESETQIVSIKGGEDLETSVDATKKVITINHSDSGVTAATYGPTTNATPSYGETFSVPQVTVDAQGHVTAAATQTITLPNSDDTTYHLGGDNSTKSITLYDNETNTAGKIIFAQDTAIEVTMTGDDVADEAKAETKTVTIKHADVTCEKPTATDGGQLAYGVSGKTDGTFTIVSGVEVNDQGHTTKVEKTTYQLPSVQSYAFDAETGTNTISLLENGTEATGTVSFTSSYTEANGGVKIDTTATKAANPTVNIDLVWGSF